MYYDTDESDFARGEWLHESGGMNIAHICTYADASRGSLRGGGSIGRAQQDGTGKEARGGPLVGPGGMPSPPYHRAAMLASDKYQRVYVCD